MGKTSADSIFLRFKCKNCGGNQIYEFKLLIFHESIKHMFEKVFKLSNTDYI